MDRVDSRLPAAIAPLVVPRTLERPPPFGVSPCRGSKGVKVVDSLRFAPVARRVAA